MLNKWNKVITLVTVCSVGQVFSYTPTREYPSIKSTSLDFRDGLFFNTQTFFTRNEPIVEGVYGEKVLSPWTEYNLVRLQESLNKYNIETGKPTQKYLSENIFSKLGTDIRFDMFLNRKTVGQDFEAGILIKNIFNDLTFESSGKHAASHKKIVSNIDLFCKLNTSFINMSSIGSYEMGEHLRYDVTDNIDDEIGKIKGYSPEAAELALDSGRRRLQGALDSNTYISHQQGMSDLIATLGLSKRIEYALKCKRIDIFGGLILSLPTGVKSSTTDTLSVDFGFPKITLGVLAGIDILLKQTMSMGVNYTYNFGYTNSRDQRVAIGKEPAMLSPLVGLITTKYGSTYTINPYMEWRNVFMERLDAKIGYSFTSHNKDKLFSNDELVNKLSNSVRVNGGNVNGSFEVFNNAEKFTSWNSQFAELKINYRLGSLHDAEEGKKSIFLSYQHPFDGSNSIRQQKLALGLNFNF